MKRMKFEDAQAMHILHPETFYAPSVEELTTVKEGSVVKVCNGFERFWTKVKSVDGDKIVAGIDNMLLDDSKGTYGNTIEFEKRHIYQIWED